MSGFAVRADYPAGLSLQALMAGGNAYRGASFSDPAMARWQASSGSADADLLPELETLRERSRDLDRNNPLAAAGIRTLLDNVVGPGLKLKASPDFRALGWKPKKARKWARKVEALWRGWADTTACDVRAKCNFAGLTRLVFRSSVSNGDAVALPLWLPSYNGDTATCLQVLEADQLSNPYGMADSDTLRAGVVLNKWGRAEAYHIRKAHPGDGHMLGTSLAQQEWRRIPARTPWGRPRVIHVYEMERPSQTRGVPVFASVMRLIRMQDRYQEAELNAAIMQAMLAVFLESQYTAEELLQIFGDATGAGDQTLAARELLAQQKGYRVPLKAGLFNLPPGVKANVMNATRPAGSFGPFMDELLNRTTAVLGPAAGQVMKDWSKANYSSARAALLDAWKGYMARRAWLVTDWCQPVYAIWLEEQINAGRVEAPDFYLNRAAYCRARWIGPGKGWIDPVKEAQGSGMREALYRSSPEDEAAEQGMDLEEIYEAHADARELRREWELSDPPYLALFQQPLEQATDRPAPATDEEE